jgi:membrane protein CcdC involved in cytochrome C biogenesis
VEYYIVLFDKRTTVSQMLENISSGVYILFFDKWTTEFEARDHFSLRMSNTLIISQW